MQGELNYLRPDGWASLGCWAGMTAVFGLYGPIWIETFGDSSLLVIGRRELEDRGLGVGMRKVGWAVDGWWTVRSRPFGQLRVGKSAGQYGCCGLLLYRRRSEGECAVRCLLDSRLTYNVGTQREVWIAADYGDEVAKTVGGARLV